MNRFNKKHHGPPHQKAVDQQSALLHTPFQQKPATSPSYDAKNHDLVVPPRQNLKAGGTKGRPILIEINYIALSFKNLNAAVHYDVVLQPDTPKKLLRAAMEEFRLQHYPNRYPAFDGTRNLYSSSMLPFGDRIRGEVTVMDNTGPKTFHIAITFATMVDLSVLSKYFESNENRLVNAQEAIQCINVVLRSAPATNCISVGHSFFTKPRDQVIDLGGGVEIYYGFYQSAILGWKPFLNVDITHKPFLKDQPILDLIRELCPRISPDLKHPLTNGSFRVVDRFIRSVKICYQVPNNPSSKRKHKVNGLGKPASEERFVDAKGAGMTVADYFRFEKKYPLRFPNMPCLWVGNENNQQKILLPAELCTILDGQQVPTSRIGAQQSGKMIKATAVSTAECKSKIMNSVQAACFNNNPSAQEFGVSVGKDFIKVPARVLDAPTLRYNGNSVQPQKGVWQPSQFHSGRHLQNWGIVCLDNRTMRQPLQNFVEKITHLGRSLGMQISTPRVVVPIKLTSYREREDLERCFSHYSSLELLIIILPADTRIYSYVKQAAELHIGTLTQCVRGITVQRFDSSIARNILLKVNAKLNGVNHVLEIRPQCLKRPCMIMGADVTHPAKGSNSPSVVAVTASFDPQAFCYNICWRLQPPTQEIISDLTVIVKDHLLFFYMRNNSTKPERIMFFRDGVSDGQFQEVLNAEVGAVRQACFLLQPNGLYKPKITFLVVQKRHHTRFFPTNSHDCIDRNGNVPVGTCIDTEITHPTTLDFYLLSHASIRGMARPTKYCILWDDNNMSEDEVEELAFHLCHMFSRCTRSVSYPAPTYYAHLAAARAKVYCDGRNLDLHDLEREQAQMCRNGNLMKDLPMFFV